MRNRQIATAIFLADNIRAAHYFIPLVLTRLAAGVLVGPVSGVLIRRLAQAAPNIRTEGRTNS